MREVIAQVRVNVTASRSQWEKAEAHGKKPFEGEVVEDMKYTHFENWNEVAEKLDMQVALDILNEGVKRRAQAEARSRILREKSGLKLVGV